jgi:Protein of unknown function (DUF4089)
MSDKAVGHEQLDAYVEAAAHLLELSLLPTWKASVATNLQTILGLSATFAAFPLPDDAEPAPVFVP